MAHDLEKKWRSDDVRLQENVDFSALLLSDRVLFGLKKAGFKKPSPIQLEAVPLSKIGKDLLVQAKSGTGKTLVFIITALEMLRRKLFRPQVMILVPTREIATQICSVIKSVGAGFPKLTYYSFIGGLSVSDDIKNAMTCQIVVGTPGRLNQLVREKALPTNSIRLFVLDEADNLLQLSFKKDINAIFNLLPEDKQVIATSATYPEKFKKLLLKYLREPHVACLNSREIALLGIIHYAKVVKSSPMPVIQYKLKLSVLEEILKGVKFSQCLVFCNGIQKVEVLYKDIKKWGFSTTYISSAKEQCDRLKAIDHLKHFKCKVLVSSDVISRGIDAENVDLVINFDLAFGTETYLHRAGRAGRYGSIGVNISIIEEKELIYFKKIEAEASFKAYKLPDTLPVDLIQRRTFGEFVIEEISTEEFDSDQDPLILDEVKADLSVGTENSIIEKSDTKSVDKSTHVHEDNNCVLANQTASEKVSDISETVASNLSFSKAAIFQTISNEISTVPFENMCYSANIEGVSQPIMEDNDISINRNSCNLNIDVPHSFETRISSSKQVDLNKESVKEKKANNSLNENIHASDTSSEVIDSVLNHTTTEKLLDVSETLVSCPSLTKAAILQLTLNGTDTVNISLPDKENNGESKDGNFNVSSTGDQTNINSECMKNEKTNVIIDKECENHSLDIESLDQKEYYSISQACEHPNIGNCDENIDLNDIYTSDIFVNDSLSKNDLDNVIKIFLNEYQSDRNIKNEEELEVEDNKKTVSICAINNLNFKKYAYVYEVCKKYQDEKNKECDVISENGNGLPNIPFQDEHGIPNVKKDDTVLGTNASKPNFSIEQSHVNVVDTLKNSHKFLDKNFEPADSLECEFDSNCGIRQVVEEFEESGNCVIERSKPGSLQRSSGSPNYKEILTELNSSASKPGKALEYEEESNCIIERSKPESLQESSRRLTYKEILANMKSSTCELGDTSNYPNEKHNYESTPAKNEFQLFEKVSDSDSDDIVSSEEVNSDISLCSSSEDSEEESSSDFSESSSSEDSYQHNKFRTGKQNPSLVSDSSSDSSERRNQRKYEQNAMFSSKYSHSDSFKYFHCSCLKKDSQHHLRHSNIRKCVPKHVHGMQSYPGHSVFPQPHLIACNRSCFQPSKHRCHYDSFCNQMQTCCHWHKTFYNQWKHLQNCINSSVM